LFGWLSDDHAHRIVVVDPSLDVPTSQANIEAAWADDSHLAPNLVGSRFTIEPTVASEWFKRHFLGG
jgi:hypothetical protein